MQQNNQKEIEGLGKIYAGEVHYSRIPVQYWEHRILMIKAMGLNALSIYIMWNYHEISRGVFDFKTDNKNLPYFLDLAEKHGMMVLFRPGPYVCAEWDFGGMPARLLSIDGLVIRANNPQFLKETRIYFEALVPIMNKYLRNENNPKGCIVMLQIENEYGFYGTDKSYMQAIRQIWADLKIRTHQYYVDWPMFIKRCHWDGAHIGINHFDSKLHEIYVKFFQKKGLIFGGEIYTGWMTHWTEKWGGKNIEKVSKNFKFLLENDSSFAMYVVHGGTNFGLTAGANGLNNKINDYWGAITSYDYDAPINEQGSVTPKYLALRELIMKHTKWEVPAIPDPIPMITIPPIKVRKVCKLLENLPNYIESDSPLVFESEGLKMFNQGIVIYETQLPPSNKSIYIKMIVHDFAVIFLGSRVKAVLDRTKLTNHGFTITSQEMQKNGNRLRVLVEASGHINFDKNMETDMKGLYYFGGDCPDLIWRMYKFPIQFSFLNSFKEVDHAQYILEDYPLLLKGEFELTKTGDVYLDMGGYGKGYLFVNGRNLGRYWSAGPQTRLFCPGVWLKQGLNQLLILNVWGPSGMSIEGFETLRDPASLNGQQSKCNLM